MPTSFSHIVLCLFTLPLLLLQLLQNWYRYFYHYYHYYHTTLLLNTLLQILSYPGVVELTTQLLILENILWLALCRINKFGLNTLPSKTVAIPYTCGLSRLFSGTIGGSIALFFEWLGIYICLSPGRTWKIKEPKSIPELRGEVRNCHLALHLIHLLFWVSLRPIYFSLLLFSDLLNQKYKNTLLQFILIYFISGSRDPIVVVLSLTVK